MAIVWTKEDEIRIKALKVAEEERGHEGLICSTDGEELYFKFRVLDHLKASLFLHSIAFICSEEEKKRIEELTGVKFLELRFNSMPTGSKEDILNKLDELKAYICDEF